LLNDGAEKAVVILSYQMTYNYPYFIETGTSFGETVSAVEEANVFNRHYTIEYAVDKYLNSFYALQDKNISLLHGDTCVDLSRLLEYLKAPAVVFLDAHPEDNRSTPLLRELDQLFYYSTNWKYVILIDDARCFEEFSLWPKLWEIEGIANRNGYNYEVKDDIIRLLPQ
jgi:hypothetical protein